ncbi:MAG TPA: diguanylate cyclase [Anaerolineales bacterium]|nr:diguanylate cyclase [Anaerolineales bacterium]
MNKPNNILSDEMFQTIFMQAGDGIFLIDEQGVVIEANPRGCEILGYPREELIGKAVMSLHPADEINHIQRQLTRLSAEKLVTIESAYIRKDGSRVPVEITGKLLSNNLIIGLLRDISERKKAEKATQELLATDSLTGLYNRRYFFSIANVLISESARYGKPITLLLLDLDHFKKVNDSYGHMKGDLALQHLANSIRYVARTSDIAARLGGDEFVIFLPQTDKSQAFCLAERLRTWLLKNPVSNSSEVFFISASIGVTSTPVPHQTISIDTLIEQADQALYKAKQQGRNQTCTWSLTENHPPGKDILSTTK